MTGEKVKNKPKKLPIFTCGKELKERVDYYLDFARHSKKQLKNHLGLL